MSEAFVWFHNSSENPGKAGEFYEKLLGWQPSEGPAGMTMLGGSKGPFAGLAARSPGFAGWVPYARVDDVETATRKATALGGEVVQERTRGPAGEFCVVRDPGGALIALWQQV